LSIVTVGYFLGFTCLASRRPPLSDPPRLGMSRVFAALGSLVSAATDLVSGCDPTDQAGPFLRVLIGFLLLWRPM